MARSSGFKMTKDFHRFLEITGYWEDHPYNLQEDAELIFELRAIAGKHQFAADILKDLEEVAAIEAQAQAQVQETEDEQEAA